MDTESMATISAVEASQNWDNVALMANQLQENLHAVEEDRAAGRHGCSIDELDTFLDEVLNDEQCPSSDLTDDEKIDIGAARVLKRFKPAFLELAK